MQLAGLSQEFLSRQSKRLDGLCPWLATAVRLRMYVTSFNPPPFQQNHLLHFALENFRKNDGGETSTTRK